MWGGPVGPAEASSEGLGILGWSLQAWPVCAHPKFLAGPARDLLLSLVVPAPPQHWSRSHPEDTQKAFCNREAELKEAGLLVPNDMVSICLSPPPWPAKGRAGPAGVVVHPYQSSSPGNHLPTPPQPHLHKKAG